ncbi:MAG: hypothetical protein K1Y02_11175 [Candidatus Hydrogenedentes bacterium]|nr:hypothetical protein [Candidatus Hydrogenedentota bacterium]
MNLISMNHAGRAKRIAALSAIAVVSILLAVTGIGCPPGKDSPPSVLLRNVDLAVGDWGLGEVSDKAGAEEGFQFAQILLYFNVLTKGSLQDPSVVFSGDDNPLIQAPTSIQLTGDYTGNDLYVADDGSDTVQIWRDYRDLVDDAKGQVSTPADVVLDCDSSFVDDPFEILNVDNRLYVSNGGGECLNPTKGPGIGSEGVLVFDNAGALVESGPLEPTLLLNLPSPRGIAVVGDNLYVCSAGTNSNFPFSATSTDCAVYVYEDIPGRIETVNGGTKGTDPLEPSVVLAGPSFLNLPSGEYPYRCDVWGNRLFVLGYFGLYVFDNADNLVDFQEPSAVIAYTTGTVGYLGDLKMVGNTLYVGDGYFPYPNGGFFKSLNQPSNALKAEWPGLTAFRPGLEIESGQNALLAFDTINSQISEVTAMANEKDVLFVASGLGECCGIPSGDVHIFYDADTLSIVRPADFVLPAYKDFATAVAIDSNDYFSPTPVP